MSKLSKQDYIEALEKMKKSSRDRVGILGELGSAGLGATAGVAASGTIAAAAGASTLMGSTTLASALGGVFVTTTPVGWVVGAGVAAGAAGYGISKLVRSGGVSDTLKKTNMEGLKSMISKKESEEVAAVDEQGMGLLISAIQSKVSDGVLPQEKATVILSSVQAGELDIDFALESVEGL